MKLGRTLLYLAALCLSGTALAGAVGWRWTRLPPGAAPPVVPADNPMSVAKVELGRQLFYDRRLSRDGTMSCAACHEQKRGFTNGVRIQFGVTGEPGIRNVQGLANVAWRTPLTWADPNVKALEQQALVPLTGTHPIEMGADPAVMVQRLGADACYGGMFARAFPASGGRVAMADAVAAIASFERTIISSSSPYDRFRSGDAAALSADAKRGEAQFAGACASCHAGPDLTDDKLHYVGTTATAGIAYGSGPPPVDDAEHFRTPPLRNVAVTGPWLHDGTAKTVEDAVRRHAPAQLSGVTMPALLAFLDAQTDVAFLNDPRFAEPVERCGVPIAGPRLR